MDLTRPTGEPYSPGAIRAQVDGALPNPGDPALGVTSPADLGAVVQGLTEATRILADPSTTSRLSSTRADDDRVPARGSRPDAMMR